MLLNQIAWKQENNICIIKPFKYSMDVSLHQWTPLHAAAAEGNTDVVRFLADRGADVNIKDERGVSEWDYTDCSWLVLGYWTILGLSLQMFPCHDQLLLCSLFFTDVVGYNLSHDLACWYHHERSIRKANLILTFSTVNSAVKTCVTYLWLFCLETSVHALVSIPIK